MGFMAHQHKKAISHQKCWKRIRPDFHDAYDIPFILICSELPQQNNSYIFLRKKWKAVAGYPETTNATENNKNNKKKKMQKKKKKKKPKVKENLTPKIITSIV